MRRDQIYGLDRPDDVSTITVSCFNISAPYRCDRVSQRLLDRVVADAPARGVTRIEAYPSNTGAPATGR